MTPFPEKRKPPLPDQLDYYCFTAPMRMEKEFRTLEGIIRGIAIDEVIRPGEIRTLNEWCDRHQNSNRSSFNDLIQTIQHAISDGMLDDEERQDIIWLCQRFTKKNPLFSVVTADMQVLQGILGGIAADAVIEKPELKGLQDWLDRQDHLCGYWPYDEIDSFVMSVMADGKIDEQEHKVLLDFCGQFLKETADLVLENIDDNLIRHGVCSVAPQINFDSKVFCITGAPKRGTKAVLTEHINSGS